MLILFGLYLPTKIEEKEQAKISYEEALESGQGSALLMQVGCSRSSRSTARTGWLSR